MTQARNPHFDTVQRVQSARLQARKLSADAIAAQFAAMPARTPCAPLWTFTEPPQAAPMTRMFEMEDYERKFTEQGRDRDRMVADVDALIWAGKIALAALAVALVFAIVAIGLPVIKHQIAHPATIQK